MSPEGIIDKLTKFSEREREREREKELLIVFSFEGFPLSYRFSEKRNLIVYLSSEVMEERESSDSSFVLLMKPQDSVADVLNFMSSERLPNAEAVMSRRINGEEVTTLLNRRSFLNDMIRSFSASDGAESPETKADRLNTGTVEQFTITSSQWSRVWRQFVVDVGREVFRVGGVRYTSPDDAVTAVASFLASALEAASKGTPPSPASYSSPSRGSWWSMVDMLVPWDLIGSAAGGGTASKGSSEVPEHSSINDMARLVILLSQQSVLALPYETLHKQYTDRCQGELFLGDIPSDSSDPLKNAMTVDLLMERAGFPTLSIRKGFRVFSLHDSEPYTLFTVNMQMQLQLFSRSDPVELRWTFDRRSSTAPRPDRSDCSCDCFGASSGFHRPQCTHFASS